MVFEGGLNWTSTTTFRNQKAHTPLSYHSFTHELPVRADIPLLATVSAPASEKFSLDRILPRLDALLMVLKTCTGRTCRHPWESLHPDGDVRNLREAMEGRFDGFYEGLEKVQFGKCERGYILGSEGPVDVRPYEFDLGG